MQFNLKNSRYLKKKHPRFICMCFSSSYLSYFIIVLLFLTHGAQHNLKNNEFKDTCFS